MIKSILFLVITALYVPSFAGHPNHDPVISQLRKRFIKATIPNAVDIPVGKVISCVIFNSKPGNYRNHEIKNHLQFRNIGGIYMNDGTNPVPSFVILKSGLHGVYKNGDFTYLATYRITDDGDFIGEWAGVPEDQYKGRPKSVVHDGYFAVSYIICKPSKKDKI